MDHLFHGPKDIRLRIPYLCTTAYDPIEKWLEYPKSQNINLDDIRCQAFRKYDPLHLQSFLQNWLFFGILKTILPIEVDKAFTRTDEGGATIVSTASLPSCLRQWHQLQAKLPVEERRALYQTNIAVLKEAYTPVLLLSDLPENSRSNFFPPWPRSVALSCAAICETLQAANKAILDPDDQFVGWTGSFSRASLLLEQMEIQGWCPFIVAGVEEEGSVALKYYFATMGAPLVKRNHRRCSDYECKAKDFLPKELQHAEGCNGCSLSSIVMEELRDLIKRDQTPIIQFVTTGEPTGNEARVVVRGADHSTPYVALSHVWMDGLGNPISNSMPYCQLHRIQQMVNSLYPTGENRIAEGNTTETLSWFWIDTLCVPNYDTYPKLNEMALPRMKEIYIQADKVLVIDSEVAACTKQTEAYEILARIRLSNWLRRLWTLQEGYFAKSLYFLIGKTPVAFVNIIRDAENGAQNRQPSDPVSASIWRSLIQGIREASLWSSNLEAQPEPSNAKQHFDDQDMVSIDRAKTASVLKEDIGIYLNEGTAAGIINAVSARTSTYLEDEAGCIAYLMGLNARQVRQGNVTEKMMNLYKALDDQGKHLNPPGCIPPGVTLLPGKRIDVDGFRWAPQSLLVGPDRRRPLATHPFAVPEEYPSDGLMIRPSGTLCEHGLRIMFPGLRLQPIRAGVVIDSNFVVETPTTTPDDDTDAHTGRPPSTWRVVYSPDSSDYPWEDMAPTWVRSGETAELIEMAIIIFSYGRQWRNVSEGLLVRIKHRLSNGALAVSRVCKMIISQTPEYDDFAWMRQPSDRVEAKWASVDQIWCVD